MITRSLHRIPRLILIAGVICLAPGLAARTIVECIDESGQKSFREFCPPGSVKKGEKKVQGKLAPGVDLAAVAAKHPVIIYTIPKCDACDLMRLQLQQRGVPFTEKDASSDPTVQDELKGLTGAKENLVKVPVMTVGKTLVSEYKPAEVNAALDAAGYPATGKGNPGKESGVAAGSVGSEAPATPPPAAAGEPPKAENIVAQ